MILLFYTASWIFPTPDNEAWSTQVANSRGVSLPLLLSSNPAWIATTSDGETWTERTRQAETWTEKTRQPETWADA